MALAEIEKRILRAMGALQIGTPMDRKPGAFSKGQRPCVAIGRVLVRSEAVVARQALAKDAIGRKLVNHQPPPTGLSRCLAR